MRRNGRPTRSVFSLCLILCLLASLLSVGAYAEANTAVNNAANGVLQLNVEYASDNGAPIKIAVGSCFLINEKTVVTANHVLALDNIMPTLVTQTGKPEEEIRTRLSYSVTVSRDVTVTARLQQNSTEMDFALLELTTGMQTSLPMTVRHSSTVQTTEKVYAIGFPELTSTIQDINTYRPDDVTITDGRVNKVATGTNAWSGANTDYIQTSCKLTHGISGGPMVDDNGYVIGICQSSWGEDGSDDDYFYAICIDQLLTVCDSLGIYYNISDGTSVAATQGPTGPNSSSSSSTSSSTTEDSTTEDEVEVVQVDTSALSSEISKAESYSSSDYTTSSYTALQEAISAAEDALDSDSQSEIDDAKSDLTSAINSLEKKPDYTMYIIIGIIAAIIVIVVILVVILNNRKKKLATNKRPAPGKANANPYAGQGAQQPQQQQQQGQPQYQGQPAYQGQPQYQGQPAYQGQPQYQSSSSNSWQQQHTTGAAATASGSGDTALLNKGTTDTLLMDDTINGTALLVNAGILVRKKNGKEIRIDRPSLVLGREVNKVDVVIDGNDHVSRRHAKIVVHDDVAYIVHLGDSNATTINGVKCPKNVEKPLSNGDVVMLADEEFEYRKT